MARIRDIVKFDLETTGVDTAKDRIVSIAALKLNVNFEPISEPIYKLINPLMQIPAGATKVHGITDAMVKDEPTFAQYAKGLFEFMDGCDLAGYNIGDFDVPLLAEEFARTQRKFPASKDVTFIDCMKIFRKKEPRDLEGALKFYTGKKIEGAHTAIGDIYTSLEVMRAQFNRYPDIANMDGPELMLFLNDGVKTLDLAGKIAVDANGFAYYNFGTKARGERLIDNPGFGQWMLKQDFNTDTKEIVNSIINKGKTLF